jgi:hypothetical protein
VVEIHSVAKVLIAELQNQEPFFCQFERYRCLFVFSDHHNFTEKRHFKLNFSSKQKNYYNYRKDYVRLKGRLPVRPFLFTDTK